MERMENDTALIREIIPLFVKDFERNVVELEDYAKKRSGAVEASRMAHSLKGAAANAGAPGLRDVALALEKAFADSRFEDAEKLMKSFKDCFSEFRKSVASHGFL
jgi:HPt (histidine-containing phosphotransfer) domain-containing protein